MRNELENIERSEKYINNELSDSDRIEFEKELKDNPELQELVDNLKALQTAVKRSEIRSKVNKVANSGSGFWKYFGIGVLVIIVASLVWVLVNPNSLSVSESDQVEQSENAEESDLYSLGGLELWTQPDVQTFSFESSDGATIEGKDGTLIIVPTNAFVDSSGQIIKGNVDFNLLEALSIKEMVLYKLKTVSNGRTLESGGMFYIEASIDGESVNVNPERPLYIEIPAFDKKEDMMAFKGEIDQNGELNWTDPQPLQKYLVKVPLSNLDFLPEGFENEVHGNLPFLGHEDANSEFVDSLYYSLQRYSIRESAQPQQHIEAVDDTVKNIRSILFETRSNITGNERDGFQSPGRDLATDSAETSSLNCGIDPSKIEAIKEARFEQTWIATKEFEERIEVLHKAPNGNEHLDIYVSNLDKDLKEADQLVANAASGEWKEKFQSFANENLTNIKDANLYGGRLSEFYQKKSEELNDYHQKLAKELAKKNQKELNGIFDEIVAKEDLDRTSTASNAAWSNPPSPSAATASNVYATQWASMGWGNIDRYYKLLDEENIETSITVANITENAEVTQWLNAINTYTSLVKNDNSFRAVFPSEEKYKNVKTHVFVIDMNEENYLWDMEFYSPHSTSEVRLELTTSSIEEVKSDLQQVSMNFGKLKKKEEWKKEQAKKAIERERVQREKREAWLKERAEIIDRYDSELARQQETTKVINKLRAIAFSCEGQFEAVEDDEGVSSDPENVATPLQNSSNQIFQSAEVPPQYPGGDDAFFNFIAKNTKYPAAARNNGIEGTVLISFVVDTSGRVTNPQVLRGIGGGCDEEAIRVILMTSPWTPGRSQGNNVSVQFTVPVRFSIR